MRAVLTILTLVVSSLTLSAQRNSYGLNINLMAVQGEVSQGSLLSDDLALGIGFTGDFPLINPRYEFSWKLDYLALRMDYIGTTNANSISYAKIEGIHLSGSGGVNIYLLSTHGMSNIYQPIRPYAFIYGGLAYQNLSTEASPNIALSYLNGGFISPLAEIGLGLKVRVNPKWAFNFQGSLRSTFDDDADGLIGSGKSPDLMGLIRFGLSYAP